MKNMGIPKLTEFESCMLDNAIPVLINDIKRGEQYAGVLPPCSQPAAEQKPKNWCEAEREHQFQS